MKRTLISKTPNVLIIHLQRLIFNFDTFANDKVNTRMEFPNVLDLHPYSLSHVINKEQAEKGEEGKQAEGAKEEEDTTMET